MSDLLNHLIYINTDKSIFKTAFIEGDKITDWKEFPFPVGSTVHLMDQNQDENEKTGKVWRLRRFKLAAFEAEKITWIETKKTFQADQKNTYSYISPSLNWEGGVVNAEQASALLLSTVYKHLEAGQWDRYFRKLLFGLVMQSPGQEELNVKFYLNQFLKFD